METIDKTGGQTPAFSLVFKDGASTLLALTAHGEGNAVTATVTNGIFCLTDLSLYFICQFLYLFYLVINTHRIVLIQSLSNLS